MSATRILFAGTPAIAVPALRALNQMELLGKGIVLAGVLTNPDRRRRHGEEEPSEVSAAASSLDAERKEKGFPPIVQLKPEKLDAFARENVGALGASLLVSFAFGRIFGPRFLALFPGGGINVHPSLLPRFRGASPIPAAILSGDRETGVSIQKLAAEMDSGDILAQERFPLSGRETTVSLSSDAASRAARLLCALLPDFDSAAAAARPQEGEITYCREIQKEEGRIDWTKSAARLDAEIRAYTPWPLSFTFRGGDKLFILEAAPVDAAELSLPAETTRPAAESAAPGTVLGTDAKRGILIQTGNGLLAVSRLQWQAKKALDWKAFLNGARDFLGAKLGGEGAARDAQ